MEIRKLVGWNLRRLRLKRGVSQETLAGEAVDAENKSMDTAHVSRIERGAENPTVLVLDKLARALGVKVTDFFKPVRPGTTLPTGLKPGRKKSK
jgi:transcriptional regulator with XRE-family HTH domain